MVRVRMSVVRARAKARARARARARGRAALRRRRITSLEGEADLGLGLARRVVHHRVRREALSQHVLHLTDRGALRAVACVSRQPQQRAERVGLDRRGVVPVRRERVAQRGHVRLERVQVVEESERMIVHRLGRGKQPTGTSAADRRVDGGLGWDAGRRRS